MITISRVTEASNTPLQIWIRTDEREATLSIPGPMMMVKVPGHRILNIAFDQPQLYGIRIVTTDREYRLDEISSLRHLGHVISVNIFDGFLIRSAPIFPGWSFVPSYLMGNTLVESGNTYIYPAICGPIGPPPGPGPVGPPPPPGLPRPGQIETRTFTPPPQDTNEVYTMTQNVPGSFGLLARP